MLVFVPWVDLYVSVGKYQVTTLWLRQLELESEPELGVSTFRLILLATIGDNTTDCY